MHFLCCVCGIVFPIPNGFLCPLVLMKEISVAVKWGQPIGKQVHHFCFAASWFDTRDVFQVRNYSETRVNP